MADRASPCGIIDITTNVAAGETATITSVLSDFELLHVVISGADGAIATVQKNGSTAAVAYTVAGPPVTQGCTITDAEASFTVSDTLTVAVTVANVTRITLFTRYPDAYAGTLTVAVA
jgi:hypothetical protein